MGANYVISFDNSAILAYNYTCLSSFTAFHISKQLRVNDQIRALRVRLIDEKQEQVGVVSREDALKMAVERGYDLVEVSPLAEVPVCKLMDYGQYQYSQKKKEKKQKKTQQKVEVKGVRLSIRTGEHDLQTKALQARKFLEQKKIVKVQLILKGREQSHTDLAQAKLLHFADILKDVAKMEAQPGRQGYQITMILIPI